MQEEKTKIQWFISSQPNFLKGKLEFDCPRMMDDAVRKARICYQQMKQKSEAPKGDLGRRMRNLPPNRQQKVVNGQNNQQRTFGKFTRNLPKFPTYPESK